MTTAVEHASLERATRVQATPDGTRRRSNGAARRPLERSEREPVERNVSGSAVGTAPSQLTGLVFQTILFFAAALSLIAVIQQVRANSHPATGVDAPPPSVFVTTD